MAKNKKSNKLTIFITLIFCVSIICIAIGVFNVINLKMQIDSANNNYNNLMSTSTQYRDRLSELQNKIDNQ